MISYRFAGFNEKTIMTEGIRNLCNCAPEYALIFLTRITNITSRSICYNLSNSHPPIHLFQNNRINSIDGYRWCCICFARRFGYQSDSFFLPSLLFNQITDKKNFGKIKEYLESDGSSHINISLRLLLKFINKYRNVFLYMGDYYQNKLVNAVPLKNLFQQIPMYDLVMRQKIDPIENIEQLNVFLPDLDEKNHSTILQFAFEVDSERIFDTLQNFFLSYYSKSKTFSDLKYVCTRKKTFY